MTDYEQTRELMENNTQVWAIKVMKALILDLQDPTQTANKQVILGDLKETMCHYTNYDDKTNKRTKYKNKMITVSAQTAQNFGQRRGFVVEHPICKNLIVDKLLELTDVTMVNIANILIEYCMVIICLKEEDQIINKLGLRDKMPEGWKWGDSPFARWEAAGLWNEVITPS